MITELLLSNIAVIERQSVLFTPGLNVITGETGAGKSVVLDGLSIVLGGRGSADLVRTGEEKLSVQAHLDLTSLSESFRETLPEIARGSELVLSREIQRNGRNRILINGSLGSVGILEAIGERCFTLCGQHSHVRLLDPASHLAAVDDFAGLTDHLTRYRAAWHAWKSLADRVAEARRRGENAILRRTELEAMLDDLTSLPLTPTLRDELDAEVRKLSSGAKVSEIGDQIFEQLGGHHGALAALSSVRSDTVALSRLNSDADKLIPLIDEACAAATEFQSDLRKLLGALQTNELALSKLRDQLAEVARLERKYRTNCGGLVALKAQVEGELDKLEASENLAELDRQVAVLLKAARALADELTTLRRRGADRLVKEVQSELAALGMEHARLSVEISPIELSSSGGDRLQILIAPNKGDDFRPLKSVASGGELSRITLALKKVLRDRSGVNVMVFDEVDSGISGKIARAVGEKLKSLAEHSQVICITHLPQIASLADNHILVRKSQGKRVTTTVERLGEGERVEEIARMLAGYHVTSAARESAKELLSSKT